MSREAKVLITSENKSQAGIKSATNGLLGFGDAAKKVGDTITAAFSVLAIAKFAKEVALFGFDAVKAFGEVERKMTQLKVAVGGSDESFGRLNNHIQKLSSLTLASKGEVQDLVARLAALGKSDADIERISSAAIHLSNVTGQGLNEAMKQVNATLSGSVDEMGKLLPELRGLTKEQLAAGDAVDMLNTKFGGLSEQMAKGVSQSLKNVSDGFGDLKENIGQLLLREFTPMIEFLNAIITGWNQAFDAHQRYRRALVEDPELARLMKAEADRRKALDDYQRRAAMASMDATGMTSGFVDPQEEYRLKRALEAAQRSRQEYELKKTGKTGLEMDAPVGTVSLPDLTGGSTGAAIATAAGAAATAIISSGSWNPGAFYNNYSVTKTDFGQTREDVPTLFDEIGARLAEIPAQFEGFITSLGTVKSLMDPIGLILEGFMEVLGPLIDEALAPLVGVFKILGQLLAKTLIPVINILTPVIKGIASIFIWFANKVIIPVGNFFIDIMRGIIHALNKIPGVNIKKPDRLSAVSLSDATAAGSESGGSGGTGGGAGASYTGSRPITFNFYNQGNVVGSGGLEELAALIESIIRRNERYA